MTRTSGRKAQAAKDSSVFDMMKMKMMAKRDAGCGIKNEGRGMREENRNFAYHITLAR